MHELHTVTGRLRGLGLNVALSVGCWFAVVFVLLSANSANAEAPAPNSDAFFETHVRPILATKCVKCHGESRQKSGLRLDSREAMLLGGDTGAAVVPGDLNASLMAEAIRYEGLEMPPDAPLSDAEVEYLTAWIAAGAAWPEHGEPLREVTDLITEADRAWWAFQPVVKPQVPARDGDTWSRNAIDRFVYARLRDADMTPAPRASKEKLVRRLYFDVVGMPPTPAEVDAFVNDTSPDAYENLVDSLLADPRYGEHWARFWLDLVRYAESDGWNKDSYRPHIWRYRDYVVNSFNDDKPYPRFVREQLAGDEMPGDDPAQLVATGFLRLGIYEYNQRDAKGHWNDIMNETTDVAGDVFLGLSMACSRCHDHKFDPILQKDYFRLRAFFEPIIWRDDIVGATEAEQSTWQHQQTEWEAAAADIRAQLDALCEPYYDRKWDSTVDKFPLDIQDCFNTPVEERKSWDHQMAYLIGRQFEEEGEPALKSMTEEDKAAYDALLVKLAEFDDLKPKPLPALMTAADFPGEVSPTVIPGDETKSPVPPGFLKVMEPPGASGLELPEVPESTGRRTALAEWIADPDNPLTTRVIVNRIWQQHFGQGIVPTASDFGRLGEKPTHPEQLNWLTATFVENGWHFKPIHKMILMSATWQQSALHPRAAEYQAKDPGEELLWRARVRRLKAEQIRDAVLLASGELDCTIGGPSVDATEPRRALYVKVFRNSPNELLHAFDAAAGLTSVSQRNITTTPLQALLLINGEYPLARSATMAERIANGGYETREQKLAQTFRLTWGREPTYAEMVRARSFVRENVDTAWPDVAHEKLTDLCHVLINSSEFLYVD